MPWEGTDPLKWAAKMKDAPRETINAFTFEIFNRVVMRTPVDTGQARSNWLVTVNQEDSETKYEADVSFKTTTKRKGPDAGKTVTKRKVKLGRSARDTMEEGRHGILFAKDDDTIYIQNNLPYIQALEYGHSKQAPNGMVGVTMAKADQLWEQAVKATMEE